MLPGKSVYVKCYDGETKWIYFLIESDELLEVYNHVSKTVLATVLKKLDCKPIYTKKFLKIKNTDQNTDFYHTDVSKVVSDYTCLAVLLVDSALKKNENYYPQMFLRECKYTLKKKKKCLVILMITSSADNSSADSNDSGEE